jgi:hypothetical protein
MEFCFKMFGLRACGADDEDLYVMTLALACD